MSIGLSIIISVVEFFKKFFFYFSEIKNDFRSLQAVAMANKFLQRILVESLPGLSSSICLVLFWYLSLVWSTGSFCCLLCQSPLGWSYL